VGIPYSGSLCSSRQVFNKYCWWAYLIQKVYVHLDRYLISIAGGHTLLNPRVVKRSMFV
jgi:hypothetical protein